MNKGEVSIIVPCYNQAEFLQDTLNSVLSQTYQNWECVIVNDGSTDKSAQLVKGFCERDDRFRLLQQVRQGPSIARNNGIKTSNGEFILPLDGDDIIEPSYLEKAIHYFGEHPETKLVYCLVEFFGEKEGVWQLPSYDYNQLLWSNPIVNSAIYRRSDFNRTTGYNPNMVYGIEDWDFWLSLLGPEDVVHRIDEVLFFYRIKDTSRTSELSGVLYEKMLTQLCENHPMVYSPYYYRLFGYNDKKREIAMLSSELEQVRSSKSYRLGKFLLKPFSWIIQASRNR